MIKINVGKMRKVKPPKAFNRDLLRQEPVHVSHVAAVKGTVTKAPLRSVMLGRSSHEKGFRISRPKSKQLRC